MFGLWSNLLSNLIFFYPACYGIGFLSQPFERQGRAGVSGTDEKPGQSGAAGGAKPID